MKAKVKDGHATIITCVTPPYIFLLWGYACCDCCMHAHPLPLPTCFSVFLMPSSLVLPAYMAYMVDYTLDV